MIFASVEYTMPPDAASAGFSDLTFLYISWFLAASFSHLLGIAGQNQIARS